MSVAAIRVAGWKAEGLRCPDHQVSFESKPGTTHPISLLQMPNGTGKTTTLNLLRAALSGEGPEGEWSADTIRDLRKDSSARSGLFQLTLLHNKERITITLQFSFDEPRVTYSTTTRTGKQPGFLPPREMQRFLNPSFVKFFVFDGELAESLLDRQHTNAEQVIQDLFQLDYLDRMAIWFEWYWKQLAETNAQTQKGLNKWRGWMERYEGRLGEIKKTKEALLKESETLRAQQIKLRNESTKAIKAKKAYQEKLTQAEKAYDDAERDVDEKMQQALAAARAPSNLVAAFGLEMLSLKNALDHAKLPDSAAREFFEDLAEDSLCICGRPLDETTRQAVRTRAQLYLGSDDVGLLNHIKGEIATRVGSDPASSAAEFENLVSDLQNAIRRAAQCRSGRDAIKQAAVHEDPELERKEKDIQALVFKLGAVEEQLRRFEETGEPDNDRIDQTWGITILEKGLKRAEKMYTEISDTLEKKMRAETLTHIVRLAQSNCRERLGVSICAEANRRVTRLMPHNGIRIKKIDGCLKLDTGKTGASVGETLGVAYAFLSTLFSRKEFQLPFVVDSPAGPLDRPKRTAVAELIPKLAGQFVAFVISTEHDGFQDALDRACPGKIQYLTLFRKGDKALEKSALKEAHVTQTNDGMLVTGQEFFEGFQLEKEGGNGV
jgi:DNA sulfur modification protein DndD